MDLLPQHTLQQSNTCMPLGCGYRDQERRASAEVRGCVHVSGFSVCKHRDWFLHCFAKRCQETCKVEKSKREARSTSAYFSLKKTKSKEIKWATKVLDFSAKARSGRVQAVWHHRHIALSEIVLAIPGYLQEFNVSRRNSDPSCFPPLKLIRLCSHGFSISLIWIPTNQAQLKTVLHYFRSKTQWGFGQGWPTSFSAMGVYPGAGFWPTFQPEQHRRDLLCMCSGWLRRLKSIESI